MRTWATGTTELAPGVFAYVQATGALCIANAGVIAGRGGTTVIDALFSPPMTRALLDETKRLSGAPIERLINTHHHVDHTLGNALFPASTRILSHVRAKAEMQRSGLSALPIIARIAPHFAAEIEGVSERLPDETFDGATLELEVDGRLVRLLHFGTGHTRGDVLVHLPEERVLFAGDVAFFDVTPLAHEGHIGAWIDVCERVLSMDGVDTIVPGHGPVGTKDELRTFFGYLRRIHAGARAAFDAGVSEREAAATIDLGEYAEWTEAERLAINVSRLYAEFRGELDAIL
jgi:glyoxylase-like metal-dependent hydrolase (beta-lactamase superfamily II)